MEILVLEHERDAPAGLLGEWAAQRGHRVEVLRVRARERGPWPDPARYGAIVALGSERSVHESPDPWIAEEVDLLRTAHGAGVPVLGLCFGAQALAVALGGVAHRAASTEIGWLRLTTGDGDGRGLDPGPWFEWHSDAFTVPPGALELARGPGGGSQGFRAGASIGLQFHPEATTDIIAGWVRTGGEVLDRNGLQAAAILRQTVDVADEARRRSFELFDVVAEAWSTARPPSVQR